MAPTCPPRGRATGRRIEATAELYQGDFLEEDIYADWAAPRREQLKSTYLVILERLSQHYLQEKNYAACIHLCQKILVENDCQEDAYRSLMQCYSRQGQRNLALRQYHLCVEKLKQELDVPPTDATKTMYHRIRSGEAI